MSDLASRLREWAQNEEREWAQNEEMIDQYYTKHGKDCIEAAAALEGVRVPREPTYQVTDKKCFAVCNTSDGWSCDCGGHPLTCGKIVPLSPAAPKVAHDPTWISVKDRLPEPHVQVLVNVEGFGIATDVFTDSGDWSNFGEEPNLTHWMPLPAAPKGSE